MKKLMIVLVVVFFVFVNSALATDYYVSDERGNNNNNGTSITTAFKTIAQAVTTATNNDTVYILQGSYPGIGTITEKISFIGMGNVTIDSGLGGSYGLDYGGGVTYATLTVKNIVFSGFTYGISVSDGGGTNTLVVRDCKFINQSQYGIFSYGTTDARFCLFKGCAKGLTVRVAQSFTNNTFVSCTTGMHFGASVATTIQDNIFKGNTTAINFASVSGTMTVNNNCFNGNTTDQANTSNASITTTNSVTSDPQFLDATNDIYLLNPASPCFGTGAAANGTNRGNIGAYGAGKILDNDETDFQFDDWYVHTDSNNTVAASGDVGVVNGKLVLEGTATEETVKSPLIDLTEQHNITRLFFKAVEDPIQSSGSQKVVDTDKNTEVREIKVRYGNSSWNAQTATSGYTEIEVDNLEDFTGSNIKGRYIQIVVQLTTTR